MFSFPVSGILQRGARKGLEGRWGSMSAKRLLSLLYPSVGAGHRALYRRGTCHGAATPIANTVAHVLRLYRPHHLHGPRGGFEMIFLNFSRRFFSSLSTCSHINTITPFFFIINPGIKERIH